MPTETASGKTGVRFTPYRNVPRFARAWADEISIESLKFCGPLNVMRLMSAFQALSARVINAGLWTSTHQESTLVKAQLTAPISHAAARPLTDQLKGDDAVVGLVRNGYSAGTNAKYMEASVGIESI